MTQEELNNIVLNDTVVKHTKYGHLYYVDSNSEFMKDSTYGWVDAVRYVPIYPNNHKSFIRERESFLKEFEIVDKLEAKCISNINPINNKVIDTLEIDRNYIVGNVNMDAFHCDVYLSELEDYYNSVLFEFYLNGKKHDIYTDKNYNPFV